MVGFPLSYPTDSARCRHDSARGRSSCRLHLRSAGARQSRPLMSVTRSNCRRVANGPKETARQRSCHCSALVGEAPETLWSGYVTLGLAHCFEQDDSGQLMDRYIIEPLAANSVECLAAGAETSFLHVCGVDMSEAASKDISALPQQFSGALWCENYQERLQASGRTWLRPYAQDNLMDLVPLGTVRSNWNFSLRHRRVLNFENIVNDADNIKQDMSIDVYGRKDEADTDHSSTADGPASSHASGGGSDLDSLLGL